MKRLITICFVALLSITAFAQKKDVTKFLGIPVDGTRAEMRQKLMAKGFKPYTYNGTEILEGEFNGSNVDVHIVTNNNKVYRIMVCEKDTWDEANIKIRFNNLFRQFENNKRYMSFKDFTLSKSEDISYEMTVNNKVYEADLYQLPELENIDTLAVQQQVREKLLQKFTQEEIESSSEEVIQENYRISRGFAIDLMLKKSVWFRINEIYGKYYLTIYYDNEYNQANGEDL